MIELSNKSKKQIHFVGICGTAMGSVASALKTQGHEVTGSDENVYPPMSTFLEEQGIEITRGYSEENLPKDADLIVIGNAISRGNPEAEAALDNKLLYQSLPETMKHFVLRGRRNLVVTGTHGKTTTTSILAWLLEYAKKKPSYMIGGIARNFGRGASFNDSEFTVLEGDEYDTAFFDKRSKFLHYLPEAVIINNIEFDHADIYDNLDQIKLSFQRLLNIVPRKGLALVNGDDKNCLDVAKKAPIPSTKIGFDPSNDIVINEVEYSGNSSRFNLNETTYEVPMSGEFNVRNAAMAVTVAKFSGIPVPLIQEGLKAFLGIARRQEVRGIVNDITVIDDFAHHPTALAQAITALKKQYQGSKLWAVFEPRSNTTRRAIFQNDLVRGLMDADEVLVSSIENSKGLSEDEMLNVSLLTKEIAYQGSHARECQNVAEIVDIISKEAQPGDVIGIFSNGGFDGIHEKLLEKLRSCQP